MIKTHVHTPDYVRVDEISKSLSWSFAQPEVFYRKDNLSDFVRDIKKISKFTAPKTMGRPGRMVIYDSERLNEKSRLTENNSELWAELSGGQASELNPVCELTAKSMISLSLDDWVEHSILRYQLTLQSLNFISEISDIEIGPRIQYKKEELTEYLSFLKEFIAILEIERDTEPHNFMPIWSYEDRLKEIVYAFSEPEAYYQGRVKDFIKDINKISLFGSPKIRHTSGRVVVYASEYLKNNARLNASNSPRWVQIGPEVLHSGSRQKTLAQNMIDLTLEQWVEQTTMRKALALSGEIYMRKLSKMGSGKHAWRVDNLQVLVKDLGKWLDGLNAEMKVRQSLSK